MFKKSFYKKAHIPKALREQVWIQYVGCNFEVKCIIPWCQNKMTVFDFHVGHNIPESHGGKTDIENLRPICARCNLSMGNSYSISQWAQFGNTIGSVIPVVEPNTIYRRRLMCCNGWFGLC